MRLLLVALSLVPHLTAQKPCESTVTFSSCDIVFELPADEAKKHPNPYLSVNLHAEFRSPRHRTMMIHGFWAGGARMVVRFTPIDPGEWAYRVSSNVASFNGISGNITAVESPSPGFVRTANVHHWAFTGNNQPHLWMGDTSYQFATMDRKFFEQAVDARASQKFNHIRGMLLSQATSKTAFPTPDSPDAAYFAEVDARILYMNAKGITADLVLAGDNNHLAEVFPTRQQRERYLRYVAARYGAMNVTWQLVQEYEEYANARELMKEVGSALAKLDPYAHPRTTHTTATSSPLLADGWMDHILYQSHADEVGAVEHQLYAVPAVNAEFAYEDSGAGRSHPHHVDTDTFRRRLWNASMNGQYPVFGNTGTYGGSKVAMDAKFLDSPGAKQMTHWFDFFAATRYWELEPHFDVDGGRAVSLPGIEYVVYVEKPSGPIELLVEKHGYDVAWFNPITGERLKMKDWKGERFVAEPPDRTHDWVLHVSREGRKEGMRSYKFESRKILMQEPEHSPQKTPFEIAEPAADDIPVEKDVPFVVKLKRDSRATRSMLYMWTAEASAEGLGARVVGTGASGTLRIPSSIIRNYPAVLNVRVTALNANGKAYIIDRVYRVTK